MLRNTRINIAALIFGTAIVVAPVAASAGPAKPLPPQVRAYFDTAVKECHDAGDRLRVTDDTSFAEAADFNGDGHSDYVIHYASLYCPALGASEYCGSAGCQVAILVSEGDRLREVAGDNYQGFVITAPVNGRQDIEVAAHGTYCGHKTGADTCFGIMRWTPKGFVTTYTKTEPAALDAALEGHPPMMTTVPTKTQNTTGSSAVLSPARAAPRLPCQMARSSASRPWSPAPRTCP